MIRHRKVFYIAAIATLATVIRLVYSAAVPVAKDSVLYFSLAERIDHGYLSLDRISQVHEFLQPGYSFVIYLVNLVINNLEAVGLAVSLASGILVAVLVYLLGRRIFNERIGLVAGCLVGLHPLLIWFSTSALTESLFACLFILIIYWLWSILAGKKSSWWFLGLGILIGISYYVRIVGLASLGAVILWILIYWLYKKEFNTKKAILSCLLVIIGVLLVICPYLYYLYDKKQQLVITGAQDYAVMVKDEYGAEEIDTPAERHQFFASLNEDKTDYRVNDISRQLPESDNQRSPLLIYWEHFWYNIGRNLFFIVSIFAVQIILIGYGFYQRRRAKQSVLGIWYLISWVPFYLFIYYSGQPGIRYYMPLIPLLLLLSSVGIISIVQKINLRSVRYFSLAVFIIVVILFEFLVFSSQHYYLKPFSLWQPSAEKQMGIYLKDTYGEGKKIFSTFPVTTYYAEGIHYPLPVDDYQSVIQFAKYKQVDYLMLFQPVNSENRPELNSLYDVTENGDVILEFRQEYFYFFRIR